MTFFLGHTNLRMERGFFVKKTAAQACLQFLEGVDLRSKEAEAFLTGIFVGLSVRDDPTTKHKVVFSADDLRATLQQRGDLDEDTTRGA